MTILLKNRAACRRGVLSYGESTRRQLTIPDQGLSINEIISRYTRGIPVDVKQYESVYLDQTEYDMEKLSRLEFSEKMSIAEELRNKYDAIKEQAEAKERAKRKDEAQAVQDRIKDLEQRLEAKERPQGRSSEASPEAQA